MFKPKHLYNDICPTLRQYSESSEINTCLHPSCPFSHEILEEEVSTKHDVSNFSFIKDIKRTNQEKLDEVNGTSSENLITRIDLNSFETEKKERKVDLGNTDLTFENGVDDKTNKNSFSSNSDHFISNKIKTSNKTFKQNSGPLESYVKNAPKNLSVFYLMKEYKVADSLKGQNINCFVKLEDFRLAKNPSNLHPLIQKKLNVSAKPKRRKSLKSRIFGTDSDSSDDNVKCYRPKKIKSAKKFVKSKEVDEKFISKYISHQEINELDRVLYRNEPDEDELFRIFQKSLNKKEPKKVQASNQVPASRKRPSSDIVQQELFQKNRRLAHAPTTSRPSTTRPANMFKRRLTPQEVQARRVKMVQNIQLKKINEKKKLLNSQIEVRRSADIRSSSSTSSSLQSKEKTASNNISVNSKNQPRKRTAHIPSLENDYMTRPTITSRSMVKDVSATVRKAYINLLEKTHFGFSNNQKKATEYAYSQEEIVNRTAKSKIGYKAKMIALNRELKQAFERSNHSQSNTSVAMPVESNLFKKKSRVSHANIHGVPPVVKPSVPLQATSQPSWKQCSEIQSFKISADQFYKQMQKYLASDEELKENGYPRSSEVKGHCRFKDSVNYRIKTNSDMKQCIRCSKQFLMEPVYREDNECCYHPGKSHSTKVGSSIEKRYSCCEQPLGSRGCQYAESHVHDENKKDCGGYMRLKTRPGKSDRVFAIDCEMSYTTEGFELTRVSVINCQCETIYDQYVKPSGAVLDYNTKFSGVTEESLRGINITLQDVQKDFMRMFSKESIFLGHSLESDLIALRIIHDNVVDTALIFPHRRGLPFKRSLRNLAGEHLGLIIQSADSEGHDSTEDAGTCIQLMKWKVKQSVSIN